MCYFKDPLKFYNKLIKSVKAKERKKLLLLRLLRYYKDATP